MLSIEFHWTLFKPWRCCSGRYFPLWLDYFWFAKRNLLSYQLKRWHWLWEEHEELQRQSKYNHLPNSDGNDALNLPAVMVCGVRSLMGSVPIINATKQERSNRPEESNRVKARDGWTNPAISPTDMSTSYPVYCEMSLICTWNDNNGLCR